ncbi:hypothetical protein D9M68_773640 [compost metagenome]
MVRRRAAMGPRGPGVRGRRTGCVVHPAGTPAARDRPDPPADRSVPGLRPFEEPGRAVAPGGDRGRDAAAAFHPGTGGGRRRRKRAAAPAEGRSVRFRRNLWQPGRIPLFLRVSAGWRQSGFRGVFRPVPHGRDLHRNQGRGFQPAQPDRLWQVRQQDRRGG